MMELVGIDMLFIFRDTYISKFNGGQLNNDLI